jgi:hypothetical protein
MTLLGSVLNVLTKKSRRVRSKKNDGEDLKFIILPKKIADIDGRNPTIFDSGCPNCISPAYSGPCLTQNIAAVPPLPSVPREPLEAPEQTPPEQAPDADEPAQDDK